MKELQDIMELINPEGVVDARIVAAQPFRISSM